MSKAPRKKDGTELPHDPARKLRPRRDPRDTGDSVDLARRPGPGDAGDSDAPGDAEEQTGRTLEEEMRIAPDDDDSGPLPHQQVANRGPERARRDGGGAPPRRTR